MSSSKVIKVCALTLYPYGDAPGQRFRIEQWEPYLRERGIEIDYFSFADRALLEVMPARGRVLEKVWALARGFGRRIRDLRKVGQYDVVFIYRAAAMVGPALLDQVVSLLNPRIILDFDDSIFLTHTADANKAFGWAKFAGKTRKLCQISAVVTVGNSFLADYARRFNKNVVIVPTSLDLEQYTPPAKEPSEGRRVIVGWTGSSTSQAHLEAFEPLLEKLLAVHDVEIRVVSNREPDFKRVSYRWVPWTMETEVSEVAKFDIGIMPLPDDDWARGKCAFKALQCMSLGVPVICSDVGANRDAVDHGANGFLASTDDEWLAAFGKLIDDVPGQLMLAG